MSKRKARNLSHKTLIRRLSTVKEKVAAGTIFIPEAPIPLESPLDIAAAGQLGLETIFFFDWEGEAGESWFRRLAFVPLADRSAAVTWEDGQAPLQIIARLSPGLDPTLWAYFLQDFLGGEGEGYGLTPLVGLPTRMTVYRPDLLPKSALRAALGAFAERTDGWADLAALLATTGGDHDPAGAEEALLAAYFDCCYAEAD